MAIGEPDQPHVDILDWHSLYNGTDVDDEAIIEGLAYRGRWTAVAAAAKAGKSTVILALAVAAATAGRIVMYLDAEMGRTDVLDRVANWMHLQPEDLVNIHYTDLPPKLDNVQGAVALWNTVEKIDPDLVIIDGLNGVVNGAENDDTTWRDMYEMGIMPLKNRGVAVVSLDNAGHGERKGPRGSSVKLDKADAILVLSRTDIGVKITATHRRTASYPVEQEYRVLDASEEGPAMRVERVDVGAGYPPATKEVCALLDELGAPIDISRRAAQTLLRQHDGNGRKASDLAKILEWRKQQADFAIHNDIHSHTNVVPLVPGNHREPREPGQKSGSRGREPLPQNPSVTSGSDPVVTLGTTAGIDPNRQGTTSGSEAEYEEPF